ncbi:MAG: M48 family metallopeptidase [Sarcina sp.]
MKKNFDDILKNLKVNIKIKKSKRKSCSMEINNKADVLVRVPLNLDDDTVFRWMEKKKFWMEKNIIEIREKNKDILNKNYNQGDMILCLGEKYKINITKENIIDYKNKIINIENLNKKENIILLYKKLAKEYIEKRIEYFMKYFKEYPLDIKIKQQKTIWGSCTHNNILSFNYKIIMAAPDIIDYLVVHEMSHMLHKNHSIEFWNCVEKILPDAKDRRKRLKEITYKLEV